MGIPFITSAVTNTAGTTITLTFNESVTGNLGFSFSYDNVFSGPAPVLTPLGGTGTTRTVVMKRPQVGKGAVYKYSYDANVGNITSVSTNQSMASVAMPGYLQPGNIVNNLPRLNPNFIPGSFKIYLDPGYRNPAGVFSSPVGYILEPGSSLSWTVDGSNNITSFTVNLDTININAPIAAKSGVYLVWDNESLPFSGTQQTIEASRYALKMLYQACKNAASNAGFNDLKVGFYNWPPGSGFDPIIEELGFWDRDPTGDNYTSYTNWRATLDRINKKCVGITVTPDGSIPGKYNVSNSGDTTLVDEPWIWSDVICPDVYSHEEDIPGWVDSHQIEFEGLKEKGFTRNGTVPLLPYLAAEYVHVDDAGGVYVGGYFMKQMLATCRALCDGAIIWGGYGWGRTEMPAYTSSNSYDRSVNAFYNRLKTVSDGFIALTWHNKRVVAGNINFTSATSLDDCWTILSNAINSVRPDHNLINSMSGNPNYKTEVASYLLPAQTPIQIQTTGTWFGYPMARFYAPQYCPKPYASRGIGNYYIIPPFKRVETSGSNTTFKLATYIIDGQMFTPNNTNAVTITIKDTSNGSSTTTNLDKSIVLLNALATDWDGDSRGYNCIVTVPTSSLPLPQNREVTITITYMYGSIWPYKFTKDDGGMSGTVGTRLDQAQFFDLASGQTWYGEDLNIANGSHDYNEFDDYVMPSEWYQAAISNSEVNYPTIQRYQKYLNGLKPFSYYTITKNGTIKSFFDTGSDFLQYNKQFAIASNSNPSYPSSPTPNTVGIHGVTSQSYAIKFNGNHSDTNQASGQYSTGGFAHFSPPDNSLNSPLIGMSYEWTTFMWFKPSAVPLTSSGNKSYILYCGYSTNNTHKCKGATFIYDDAGGGTYNNGTSTVSYPAGPKLVWDHSADYASQFWGLTTAKSILTFNTNFAANKWYSIATRFNRGTLKWSVFVNGVLDNEMTVPPAGNARSWRWRENTWAINCFDSSNPISGASGRSNHTIGEIAVFKRELSKNEILKLHKSMKVKFGITASF